MKTNLKKPIHDANFRNIVFKYFYGNIDSGEDITIRAANLFLLEKPQKDQDITAKVVKSLVSCKIRSNMMCKKNKKNNTS
jgi:hypothetical protein